MIRRTLGQARAKLARIAGTSGFKVNDPRIVDRLNEATEELMNEGEWPGVVDRYLFSSNTGDIILPSFLDRIMGVALNNIPYSMRSPWYEFVEYGPGPQGGCNWIDTVIDRDETPLQFAFPGTGGPYSLYTKCELDESVDGVTPTMLVQGFLYNSRREVRTFYGTSYISGEQLDLSTQFYGTAQFSEITGVVKPETNGYVELWATNGLPSQDVLLASYAPQETTPSYHAYFIPALKGEWIGRSVCPPCYQNFTNMQILVRGRRRFVPVENDNDILIISNLPALMSMIMAIQKREISDIEGYGQYKGAAVDILRKEAFSYRGKARNPAITFDPGASMGDMIYVR
jgi:hypothetical protein